MYGYNDRDQLASKSYPSKTITNDAYGLVIGMQYHANTYAEDEWDVYWFERSMLGDIIAVYASDGTKLIEYHYDAWGIFCGNRASACPRLLRLLGALPRYPSKTAPSTLFPT